MKEMFLSARVDFVNANGGNSGTQSNQYAPEAWLL